LTILFVVYASLVGGIAEHIPLMKIVHQVGVTALLGAWLAHLWRSRHPFPPTPFDWPLWLAGVGWLAAAIASRDPRVSLEFTWPIFVHILLLYLFVALMRQGRARWLLEGLFFASTMVVAVSVLEVLSWYFGLSLFPQLRFEESWPALFGLSVPPQIRPIILALGHKNAIGAHCVLMIPLAIGWASAARRRDLRWALRFLALGLAGTLLLSQSRGAYLGLVAIVGLSALFWLLRPEVRRRFPAPLRAALSPVALLTVTILAGVLAVVFVFWFTLERAAPEGDDIARLDMWMSAVEMFRDRPLLGVGTYQYGSIRLEYPHLAGSPGMISLRTAHNVVLHIAAEGGIVLLTLLTWLAVRFARAWWVAWQSVTPRSRRELEGILIALIAFGVHNMVDTFLATQLLLPVLIMVAYVAYRYPQGAQDNRITLPLGLRRRMAVIVAALLVVVQGAFVPLHWGALAHQQALAALSAGKLEQALEHERAAQRADPWLHVYPLQEANILGRLAYEDPAGYLSPAIAAHERSLALMPSWHLGWHNLAALYAQAGRYEEAIRAGQTALEWYSLPPGYHLKLGEYYEHAGRMEEARAAYYEALRLHPPLAGSAFWSDPDWPQRPAILAQAVTFFADRPALALDLAMYAGDRERAVMLARGNNDSPEVRMRADLLLSPAEGARCQACYFLAIQHARQPDVRRYLVQAERLLQDSRYVSADGLTAWQAAGAAWFLSEGTAPWAWYVRARLAEREGASAETVDALLERSTQLTSSDDHLWFARTVFGVSAALETLPQAQTPVQSPFDYQPWLQLAHREAQQGNREAARLIYERIVDHDPYAWPVLALLEALPAEE
jgi:putative inorganic carbon (HCO3(-)) transporter